MMNSIKKILVIMTLILTVVTGFECTSIQVSAQTNHSVSVIPVNLVMYATADCMIHAEPIIGSETVGSLVKNQPILVTGLLEIGWYQVDFCGITSYMTGGTLSLEPVPKERHEYTVPELVQMCLAECVTEDMTATEKAIAVNDYLCGLIKYPSGCSYRTTFDALAYGLASSQGYANAYERLMDAAGVPTDFIGGRALYSSGWLKQAFNRVLIDGQYYYVDVEWNDKLGTNAYLLLTYEQISGNHLVDMINPSRIQ